MINTLVKHKNKANIAVNNILSDIYLLPNWEKIKEFSFTGRSFFNKKSFKAQLYRKFSSKHMIEKYSMRTGEENEIAKMDLKVYKDCVYIINLDCDFKTSFNSVLETLIQVAVEKGLYNTENKEVKINLLMPVLKRNAVKRILIQNGFMPEGNQSKYEKEMFGETYFIKAEKSLDWKKRINHLPILINR